MIVVDTSLTEYAIELDGVRKAYEKKGLKKRLVNALTLRGFVGEKTTALDEASLKVRRGEVFGLLGPNGAGKTTMIKVLTTILTPDSGTAIVDGFNVVTESLKVRERIGVLYEDSERGFGWRLSTWTNLMFYAREYMVDNPRKRVEEVLKIVELEGEDAFKWFQKLSKGMKQKAALARALIPDAQVLFLDEPQRSLDILFVLRLKQLIKEKFGKPGRTIFLSTHDMHLIEETCDRIAVIDKGRIVKVGTVEELKSLFKSMKTSSYTLEVAHDQIRGLNRLAEEILHVDGVEEAKPLDLTKLKVGVTRDKPDAVNQILKTALEHGYHVTALTEEEISLEESIAKILRGEVT